MENLEKKHLAIDFKSGTSDMGLQIWDFRYGTSDMGLQIWDFRYGTSDIPNPLIVTFGDFCSIFEKIQ